MIRSTPLRRRATALAALLAACCLPARASGQATDAGRWSAQPSAGILIDAYDVGSDGSRIGPLVGLEVGRRFSASVRGAVSVAYARVNDVGTCPPAGAAYAVYRNEWVFASVGPVLERPVRRATVSLSLQAGAAWRRTRLASLVGNPDPNPWLLHGSDDFPVTGVVIPSMAVRLPLARRLAVVGGASAYLLSPDEGGEVSPAFTLGIALMP